MHAQQAGLVTLPEWYYLLQDTDALIREPMKHHRELLHRAYALRDAQVIQAGTLAEMLELADEALVYAPESTTIESW